MNFVDGFRQNSVIPVIQNIVFYSDPELSCRFRPLYLTLLIIGSPLMARCDIATQTPDMFVDMIQKDCMLRLSIHNALGEPIRDDSCIVSGLRDT